MDVLTDTEMPDRCTDAPQNIRGEQMSPQCPHGYLGIIVWGNIQMYMEGMGAYRHMRASECIGGVQTHGTYRCPLC